MELGNVIRLLENSQFAYCLGSTSLAREVCIEAIKELNKVSKELDDSADDLKLIQVVSKYLLKFYELITKGNNNGSSNGNGNGNGNGSDFETLQRKVKWLASKINGQVFPPIIQFGEDVTSLNNQLVTRNPEVLKEGISSYLTLPSHIEASFVECPITSVNADLKDLQNLYQDLLTNCSFVCAILAIVNEDPQLLTSRIIVPKIRGKSRPEVCRVKIFVNGCERLVTIDNTLPMVIGELDRNLVIRSSSKIDLWWPALLEKAYLTVMGFGYNFRGSNMALDVYMMSGWIPEVIRVKNGGLLPDEIREIMVHEDRNKNVMLGLGVGTMSDSLAKLLDLIPEHDYAVVGRRFNRETGFIELNIRNPWSKVSNEISRWVPEPKLHNFNYLYVNWNQKLLFDYEKEIILIGSSKKTFWDNDLYDQPQVNLSLNASEKESELWLLLERYLPSKLEGVPSPIINILVYLTENGEKVLTTEQYPFLYKSPVGTNNRTLLVKLQLLPLATPKNLTIVVESNRSSTYTLKSFCNISHTLNKTTARYKYTLPIIEDEWNVNSNGGNFTKSTFINNPQYKLSIPEDNTDLTVGLFGEIPSQYYNVHLFSCDSVDSPKSLKDLLSPKNLINGTKYKMGSSVNNFQNLPRGAYRIVFSTYEVFNDVRQPLKFKVILNSDSEKVSLEKTYNTLGLFLTKRRVISWEKRNRIKLSFQATANTKLKLHIQFCKDPELVEPLDVSDYRPAIRASIFCKATEKPILLNEEWSDSIYGVFLDVNLKAEGQFILLIERFEMGSGGCIIDVGSSRKIKFLDTLSK